MGAEGDPAPVGPGSGGPGPAGADPVGDDATSALEHLLRRTGHPVATPTVGIRRRLSGLLPSRVPGPVAAGVLVFAVLVGVGSWRFLARPEPIEERMPLAVAGEEAHGVPDTTGGATAADASAAGGPVEGSGAARSGAGDALVVHVAGAVVAPGVVELPAGSRVADAVAAGGGAVALADVNRLNLAAELVDGARVYVPAMGEQVQPEVALESPGASAGQSSQALVDINAADAAELESLPGVGPATAEAIIEHRERNGRFESADALLEVRGIGESKLAGLADRITLG